MEFLFLYNNISNNQTRLSIIKLGKLTISIICILQNVAIRFMISNFSIKIERGLTRNSRSTTVSTIIITFNNISVIITKFISNQGMISGSTSLYQMACTFRTGIFVCIQNTAVPTIIVALCIVGLIITECIANQFNIITSRN